MTTFEVYDCGRKAEMSEWVHPVCTDFESAVVYAKKWLGEYESLCPDKPNQVIDYCGYGSSIEIREINMEA